MGLGVRERKMGKESEWRKKEDMTAPVKDISCHRTLLLSSLPAPFLQSCSACFTDHCLSFNLFSVLTSLCSPSPLAPLFFFPLLLQLIIFECLLINRINVFTDALCHALVPLSCFTVSSIEGDGSFFGLDCAQSESGGCITCTLFEREKKSHSEA